MKYTQLSKLIQKQFKCFEYRILQDISLNPNLHIVTGGILHSEIMFNREIIL